MLQYSLNFCRTVTTYISCFAVTVISYIYILIGTTDGFELQYYLISNLEIVTLNNLYLICLLLILSLTFKLALFPFQW